MTVNHKNMFAATLLGGTAIVMASGASQAADLPSRKAEPVSYVKICDAYGQGFFVIPGTNTCVKIGAQAQILYYAIPAQTTLDLAQSGKGGLSGASVNGAGLSGTKGIDYGTVNGGGIYQTAGTQDVTGTQVDVRVRADARTLTDYGVLRTYAGLRFKFETGIIAGSGTALAANGEGGSESKIAIDSAFIQYLGFTAGYVGNPFSFYYEDQPVTALTDPHGSSTVLNYTLALDNGISLIAGVDNPAFHIAKGSLTACCSGLDANAAHGGVGAKLGPFTWPDINLVARIDQPWGSAQIAGLVHPINVQVVNTDNALGGQLNVNLPSQNVHGSGFAVLGGIKFNLPTGDGDQLWFQGVYANGALEALGVGGNQGNLSYGSQTRLLGGFQRQDQDAFAVASPIVAGSQSVALQNTTGFSGLLAFQHYFIADTLRGNLLASYVSITPGNAVQNTDWLAGGLSKAQEYKIGANLIWSPIKGMDIAGEVLYTKLQQKLTNDNNQFGVSAASCTPGATVAPGSPTCNILNGVKVSPGNVETALQITRRF